MFFDMTFIGGNEIIDATFIKDGVGEQKSEKNSTSNPSTMIGIQKTDADIARNGANKWANGFNDEVDEE